MPFASTCGRSVMDRMSPALVMSSRFSVNKVTLTAFHPFESAFLTLVHHQHLNCVMPITRQKASSSWPLSTSVHYSPTAVRSDP